MATFILVEGPPGTGKSRAIINLNPDETIVVKPNKKQLPFPGSAVNWNEKKGNIIYSNDLRQLGQILDKVNTVPKIKVVVIEDLTHFFSHRVMDDMKLKGYDKWTNLAYDTYRNLLQREAELRDDLFVIIIGHTQVISDIDGAKYVTLQTPGKLLEDVIKIPSYVTYVLHSDLAFREGKPNYFFITNRDGSNKEAKSPEECLELYEENDYDAIIKKIIAYHNKK